MIIGTRTSYSVALGGGIGHPNIGGWNTTLTDRSSGMKEVPGMIRREGANAYIYGFQGAQSASAKHRLMAMVAPATDPTTDAAITPVVFTAPPTATANGNLIKAMTIQTCDTNTFGWYFVEGICTVVMGDDSGSVAVGSTFAISTASAGYFGASVANTAVGVALTGIASADSGLAWVSFLRQECRTI